jgi:hypothetical protein
MFHVKILLFVTAQSDQDPDPHWFGSLHPDPHCGKKIDPYQDAHRNQCGSATRIGSVADPDPVSGIRIGCHFDPWIRDPGWVESQHSDPGSGLNNPDHIF